MTTPTIVTPPATSLVSLDTMKNFARIDGTADDALLTTFISAATDLIEKFTGRSLITRTLKLTLDAFPAQADTAWWDGVRQGAISSLLGSSAPIVLPRGPILGVTSITTYDDFGAAALFPALSYRFEPSSGRVVLAGGGAWPNSFRSSAGVEVVYTAGYGASPANVPGTFITACMMQAQQFYDSRTCGELCDSVMKMLMPYRILPGL